MLGFAWSFNNVNKNSQQQKIFHWKRPCMSATTRNFFFFCNQFLLYGTTLSYILIASCQEQSILTVAFISLTLLSALITVPCKTKTGLLICLTTRKHTCRDLGNKTENDVRMFQRLQQESGRTCHQFFWQRFFRWKGKEIKQYSILFLFFFFFTWKLACK